MKAAVIVNPHKSGAAEALAQTLATFRKFDIDTVYDQGAKELDSQYSSPLADDELSAQADLFIILGGDGTMLNATKRFATTGKPMAGVNTGALGFLTTCTIDGLEKLAHAIKNQACAIIERTLLKGELDRGHQHAPEVHLALNEFTMARGISARLIAVDAFINGSLLSHYRADGLIVTTPTGSTAYSLSAGGPLLAPDARVIGITPICPHTLSNRSLVINDSAEITLVPRLKNNETLLFSQDGSSLREIHPGGQLKITTAQQTLPIINLDAHSYYQKLRQKLKWSGGEIS